MATALVRDLDDAVYERLKARAAGNNRSLEAELREILVLASKQVESPRRSRRQMRRVGGWRAVLTPTAGRSWLRNAFGD
jgi:plasmid stability protein